MRALEKATLPTFAAAALRALLTTGWLGLAGCSTVYYAAMEQLGWEPRDVLVSRVETARDALAEAKTRFLDALGAARAVQQATGRDAAAAQKQLRDAYAYANARAQTVRRRLAAVQSAAGELFTEWRDDVATTKDAAARARTQQLHDSAEARYQHLLTSMQSAADAMPPVLDALRDQVALHTATGSAPAANVAADGLAALERAVARSVDDFEQAIAEADVFIKQLGMA
ncbi:MAG: DUF2959 family protein [bacterium]